MPRRNTVEIEINADDNASGVINQAFGNADRQAQSLSQRLTSSGESLRNLGVNLTLAAAPFVYGFKQALSASIEFESAFAGVVKTVDGTDAQLQDLRDTIRAMATDATNPLAGLENAHLELAKIMELGGQLGIPIMALEDFTSTVGMLGMATNLTTEDAATMIAQFANITGMDFSNFDRFGSTLVALGNNSATTEDAIMRMASRIAGAGSAAGLTETEILGFAAALSSMGINAELGGSNFSKLLTEITKMTATGENLQQLATISGMTANEFKTAWGEDATGALLAFIGGMSQLDTSEQIIALEDLGLTGTEMTRIMQSMTGNTDLLRSSLELAGDAWGENTALVNEANARFETTEAKANLARNALYDLRIEVGDALKEAFNQVLAALLPLLSGLTSFVVGNEELVQGVALAAIVIGGLGAAFTILGQVIIVATSSFTAIKTAMTGLSTLIAGINAPLIALIALAGVFYAAYTENFLGFRDIVDGAIADAIEALRQLGLILWYLIDQAAQWAGVLVPMFIEVMAALVTSAAESARNIVNSFIQLFSQVILNAIAFSTTFVTLFLTMVNAAINSANALVNQVIELVLTMVTEAITNLQNLKSQVGLIFTAIQKNIGQLWNDTVTFIVTIAAGIWDRVQSGIFALQNGLLIVFLAIRTVVIQPVIGIIESLINTIGSIWDNVQPGLTSFLENMDALWAMIRDDVITPVANGIQDVITFLTGIWEDVQPSVQAFANGIGELLGPVAEFIGGLAGSIEDLKAGLQSLPGVANQAGDLASAATSDPIRFFQSVGATFGLTAPPAPGGSADGGFISGGFPRIVGERGPELFVPPSAGRVIPNDEISGRGGGFSFGDIYVSLQNGGYAEGQAAGRGFAEQLELELRRRSA